MVLYEVKRRSLPQAPYYGNLPRDDIARICYWLSINVDNNPSIWSKRPLYHAVCLALAARNNLSAAEAWEKYQIQYHGLHCDTDIDMFALHILEDRMFDQSYSLGLAALSQWGLDAGDHQQKWNPYEYGPTSDRHTEAGWDCDSEEYNMALQV